MSEPASVPSHLPVDGSYLDRGGGRGQHCDAATAVGRHADDTAASALAGAYPPAACSAQRKCGGSLLYARVFPVRHIHCPIVEEHVDGLHQRVGCRGAEGRLPDPCQVVHLCSTAQGPLFRLFERLPAGRRGHAAHSKTCSTCRQHHCNMCAVGGRDDGMPLNPCCSGSVVERRITSRRVLAVCSRPSLPACPWASLPACPACPLLRHPPSRCYSTPPHFEVSSAQALAPGSARLLCPQLAYTLELE